MRLGYSVPRSCVPVRAQVSFPTGAGLPSHWTTALLDQPHSLKLELPRKSPSLHDPPPVPSKHLTRRLQNRVQVKTRVSLLREVSDGIVSAHEKGPAFLGESALRMERVFQLGMGIFRLEYAMNFLMNLCSQGQIVGILLVGG